MRLQNFDNRIKKPLGEFVETDKIRSGFPGDVEFGMVPDITGLETRSMLGPDGFETFVGGVVGIGVAGKG